MDQLFCMRVFARVVEQGSFARAAEDLEIAPPTATGALAQLEKHLGVRLLHRTTRRLSLTDEGRTFYQSCVRMLDDLAEAEEALSGAHASPRGRLRVSTPHSFLYQDFLPALPRFLERYPQLDVELVLTDRAVKLLTAFSCCEDVGRIDQSGIQPRDLCQQLQGLIVLFLRA